MHPLLLLIAVGWLGVHTVVAVAAEASRPTIESLHLQQWAVEVMSVIGIIGSGSIVLWARWQKTRLASAKEWYEFQAPSLQTQVLQLTEALKAANANIEKFKVAAEADGKTRGELTEQNAALSASVAHMAQRIDDLTQHMSQIACPFVREGHARCAGADEPVPAATTQGPLTKEADNGDSPGTFACS